jgi:hypothetical protein
MARAQPAKEMEIIPTPTAVMARVQPANEMEIILTPTVAMAQIVLPNEMETTPTLIVTSGTRQELVGVMEEGQW